MTRCRHGRRDLSLMFRVTAEDLSAIAHGYCACPRTDPRRLTEDEAARVLEWLTGDPDTTCPPIAGGCLR